MSLDHSTDEADDGFTLIELLVSGLLGVLVLIVVAGIMISSTTTESLVRNVSTATKSGQSATNSIERGIRNAAYAVGTTQSVKVTVIGSDQIVTALVVGNGATATTQCEAWYFSSTAKTIRYHAWTSGSITAPIASVLSTWTLLASGVTPVTGTTIFTQSSSTELAFSFKADAGKDPAIPFQSAVSSQTGVTGSVACF
ncbi:MAG: hypothetical protein JWN80_2341, partial [Microbacteriaceae bacterium]|nr:hypothetical protein [Microbacteriaceae bacterium]